MTLVTFVLIGAHQKFAYFTGTTRISLLLAIGNRNHRNSLFQNQSKSSVSQRQIEDWLNSEK